MTSKDFEQSINYDLPSISPKTSGEQLLAWSKKKWPSEGRARVAQDIIKNGKELLYGINIDWGLALRNIRVQRLSSVHFGEAAIAGNDAITIGGLGGIANWPMHHPEIVYLSAECLVNRIKGGGELEDFKNKIRQVALDYGEKSFADADKRMEILDFFLGIANRANHRTIIEKVQILLGGGDVKEAYSLIKSRGALVKIRGPNSSRTTTSSILTPPKPGI